MKLIFSLVLFILPLNAFWNPIRDQSRKGLDAMQAGRHEESASCFEMAKDEDPEDPLLLHNAAVAVSKSSNASKAAALFEKALSLTPPGMKETILYHAGNHAFRQGDYQTAIQRFTEALRLKPDRQDTKWNLELARLKLRQNSGNQQQQQQQNGRNQRSNGSRQNESGGLAPTKGADPYDNPHDPRSGQGQPVGDPQKGPGGSQAGSTSRASSTGSRLSREQAEQILQSLEDHQKQPLKTLPPQSTMPRGNRGRDW